LNIFRSQYYKHDFAILPSAGGLSTNYVVAGFVKYSENIVCFLFQQQYFYKVCAKFNAKKSFKIQNSNCLNSLKHELPDRIGGGQYGASIQKI
jgi:hypothetical protein